MNNIHPVILCGGEGTRLWPASTKSKPKPFLKLLGKTSFFQETIKRVNNKGFSPPMIVCQKQHLYQVQEQLYEIGIKDYMILLEKEPRNTLTATALAAKASLLKDKEARILALPSDHYIERPDILNNAIHAAYIGTTEDKIVIFGAKPVSPDTRYGYIKADSLTSLWGANLLCVEGFTEKPDINLAKVMFSLNNYFWNMGIYFSKAQMFLQEIEKFQLGIVDATGLALEQAVISQDGKVFEIDDHPLRNLPKKSIDHALAEKSTNLVVYPDLNCGWTDIGTWEAISNLWDDAQEKNSVIGENIVLENCENSLVMNQSQHLPLKVNGVTGHIIILSDSGALVQAKENLNTLSGEFSTPQPCYRPWGYFTILGESETYKLKKLHINPHSKLSLQLHRHRCEKWTIVKGEIMVTKGKDVFKAVEGDTIFIEKNELHRIENASKVPAEVIEIQMGEILDENDIERFQDMYGRA